MKIYINNGMIVHGITIVNSVERVEAIAKHLDKTFPGILAAGGKYCSLQGDLLAGVTIRKDRTSLPG